MNRLTELWQRFRNRDPWCWRKGRVKLFILGPGDARKWYPIFGIYNTKPTEWPGFFVGDGELTVYVAVHILELSVILKRRPAQCVRGEADGSTWWDVTERR